MRYSATVRFGAMGNVGGFSAGFSGLRLGDRCVISNDRGTEIGDIISPVERLDKGEEAVFLGEILRKAGQGDLEKLRKIEEEDEPRDFRFCQKKIKDEELPMKLVKVEHLFGGSKIIFYFLADGRVDFRRLVKDLALEYHTRIEMKQIGVRDEARLLADYEHCGRELCCKTFLKNLEPVTMKMAKNQKATLDPAKISGRCGRLMCCLRFEEESYRDLRRNMPDKGSKVTTPKGVGKVVNLELIKQQVTVDLGEGREEKFQVSELEEIADTARAKDTKRDER